MRFQLSICLVYLLIQANFILAQYPQCHFYEENCANEVVKASVTKKCIGTSSNCFCDDSDISLKFDEWKKCFVWRSGRDCYGAGEGEGLERDFQAKIQKLFTASCVALVKAGGIKLKDLISSSTVSSTVPTAPSSTRTISSKSSPFNTKSEGMSPSSTAKSPTFPAPTEPPAPGVPSKAVEPTSSDTTSQYPTTSSDSINTNNTSAESPLAPTDRPSLDSNSKDSKIVKIAAALGASLGVIVLAVAAMGIILMKRRRKQKAAQRLDGGDLAAGGYLDSPLEEAIIGERDFLKEERLQVDIPPAAMEMETCEIFEAPNFVAIQEAPGSEILHAPDMEVRTHGLDMGLKELG
ncbi:hypothetical protein BJ508DRAFT_367625 [Ascobolus immersus RN42]|uniref:Extracellular membrane protein CFEM domain-containing protein n=1 Tax=Ascobolus immersus RN42 TaxID=1160509 RepID=A0A3N4HBA3_ASCIM|nr:hypothetical protein BJ508DRAFT_367625 [Ascobolus immersus RN42]